MKRGALPSAFGVRSALVALLFVSVAVGLVTCRGEPAPPLDTVGFVASETVPTTLLPFVIDTTPPDPTAEPTVPPDTLFAGDTCLALDASDFANINFAGLGNGVLIDASPLSDDWCGFLVRAGNDVFDVSVQASSVEEFGQPPASDEERIALTNIGLSAYRVAPAEDVFQVWVKVANGYFIVTAPDARTAERLAAAATKHAAG